MCILISRSRIKASMASIYHVLEKKKKEKKTVPLEYFSRGVVYKNFFFKICNREDPKALLRVRVNTQTPRISIIRNQFLGKSAYCKYRNRSLRVPFPIAHVHFSTLDTNCKTLLHLLECTLAKPYVCIYI